jgi:hypothetical protein
MHLEPFRSFHSICFSYYHVYRVLFDLLRTTHYYLNEKPKGMCEVYVSTRGRCICLWRLLVANNALSGFHYVVKSNAASSFYWCGVCWQWWVLILFFNLNLCYVFQLSPNSFYFFKFIFIFSYHCPLFF